MAHQPLPAPGWYPDAAQAGTQRYWDGETWTDQRRPAIAAGWYPDPEQPATQRYWDGQSWTEQRAPFAQAAGNGMAVAALVCGIVGAVIGLVPILFLGAWILGVLAFIFGVVGRDRPVRRGMATAGIVLGVIAIALGVVGVIIVNDAAEELDEDLQELQQEFE